MNTNLQLGTRNVIHALLAACLVVQVVSAQPPQPLVTVERNVAFARPTSFDADGRITFETVATTGAKPETLVVPVDELIAWGAPVEFGRGIYVLTADGGVFSSETVAVTGEELDFLTATFDSRTLPLSQARGVVLRPPASAAARDRMFHLAERADGDRDRLMLIGGDRLEGTLTKLDSRQAAVETSVGAAQIELGRVAAVVFNPALTAKFEPRPRTVVGLRDGTLLICSAVTGTERLTLAPIIAAESDAKTAKPWICRADEVAFLQRFGGQAVYLSDLTPIGYKQVPYFELTRDYQSDRNVNGGDLRAGGRRYLKGLGLTSTARLTYALDPAHKKFAAEIAIDDDAAGRGSVMFRVFVDAEERFRSEVVRGGDAPRPITVDVAGGRTLSLVVDFAERADELDHADWLNARLLP